MTKVYVKEVIKMEFICLGFICYSIALAILFKMK